MGEGKAIEAIQPTDGPPDLPIGDSVIRAKGRKEDGPIDFRLRRAMHVLIERRRRIPWTSSPSPFRRGNGDR